MLWCRPQPVSATSEVPTPPLERGQSHRADAATPSAQRNDLDLNFSVCQSRRLSTQALVVLIEEGQLRLELMSPISESHPIKISTVGELITSVHEMVLADNEIRWFRGHASASWNVEPQIWRQFTEDEERNFTNRFRTRAAMRRPSSPASDDYSGWLSLMQHYGLPTRLLDWTRSPLIAAYFAVSKYRSVKTAPEDAVIWVLKPHTLNPLANNQCNRLSITIGRATTTVGSDAQCSEASVSRRNKD